MEQREQRLSYAEVFEAFPSELRLPIARLVDALKVEFEVPRTDFTDLKTAVQGLAAAQVRTEARVDRLSVAVEELAQAQKRTEHALAELAQAQARTQEEVTLFRRTFMAQIGGLGARWGLQTEEAFRHGIRTILREVGFTAERFLTWDAAGEVFGHPEQVELDIVVQNGKVIVVEIKSSLDRANTYLFNRNVEFYTRHTDRQVDRKVVIASYADGRAKEVAMRLGIEVCTDVTEFK